MTKDAPGRWILQEAFEKGLQNWVFEGDEEIASVEVEEGEMIFRTVPNEASVGAFVWYREDLPADFCARWTVTPQTPGFYMVFFAVRGADGEEIFSPRHRGVEAKPWGKYFQKYTRGQIDGYHISYHRGEQADCNLRKNAGLILLQKSTQGPYPLQMGRAHRVTLTKKGGRIHLAVDGTPFMDFVDDGDRHGAVYGPGKFGFRQVYGSVGRYSDIQILDLTGDDAPAADRPRAVAGCEFPLSR